MSSNFQSSFCEAANEILELAMSLKKSFEAEESEQAERINNLDVGAELQNSKFDAAIKTSSLSHKRKKIVPKRRKEEIRVSSNITHSENTRRNLYENVKTISESQESKKVDNLNVGAETQNLKFDAAIKTTGFSCHVTHFENTRQNLHENVKTISESQERIAEIDKMSLKESYEAEESEQAERTNNLDVGAELQNSKFDAAIKTSSLSCKRKKIVPKRRKEEIRVSSNITHSENTRQNLYENVKTISESQERLAVIDKIRIIQVKAHGALTSTKLSYLKEVIRLHKPDIILSVKLVQVNHQLEFSQTAGIRIQGLKIYTIYRSPRRHEKNVKLREQQLELLEKHVQNYELQGPNITLIENMVEDLSKLLLKTEQETVPKVKIKVDEFSALFNVVVEFNVYFNLYDIILTIVLI